MATACGIEMMESRLMEENGRAHFMTKRFDREGGAENTMFKLSVPCSILILVKSLVLATNSFSNHAFRNYAFPPSCRTTI
jgi:hypothetical protein